MTHMNRSAIFVSAKSCALVPLVIFIVWIGMQPRFFLDRMSPTLKDLSAGVMKAAEERDQGQGSGFRISRRPDQ